ncbi:MAG: MIP/aquaporin family protein [Candidatus Acidiferrales bacterium]
MYSKPQKLIAEFFGTFALIFFGMGAICASQMLRGSGDNGLGLLGVALAYGLAMGVMVTSLGHISGGHFNPAVTIGFWVTRRQGLVDALLYWFAQLLGATAAAFLLRVVVPDEVWQAVQLGTPSLANGLTRTAGMLIEGVMAFFLVFVVFATAVDDKRALNKIAGFAIGLTVTMGALFGGPFTGGSMNPARAFGPALASHHWANHGVYWVGPLAGGVLAGWIYDSAFLRKT